VGRALGRRLREEGWKIGAVVTRNEATARKAVSLIGAGQAYAAAVRNILAANVILVTVPDDALGEVADELARIGSEELSGKIVLHTSGALDSTALQAVKKCGAAVGSMHPLQTFTEKTAPPLDGRIFAVEGDPAAVRVARQIARALGGSPVSISAGNKVLYHAAAAMAAGGVLAVEEAATQLLISLGMARREAVRALLPLTRQVLENFESFGPRTAWTGPLSRGDYEIVAAHLRALRDLPEEFAAAYVSLNRLAARTLAQPPAEMLADLEKISAQEKPKVKAKGNSA